MTNMHHQRKDMLELINPLLLTKNWVKKSWKDHAWETNFWIQKEILTEKPTINNFFSLLGKEKTNFYSNLDLKL